MLAWRGEINKDEGEGRGPNAAGESGTTVASSHESGLDLRVEISQVNRMLSGQILRKWV